MIERHEEYYQISTKLIDENPNLTTKQIPDYLLNIWLYRGEMIIEPPFELVFAISIFQYANDKYGDPSLINDPFRIRFERFQQALATEYVCRKVGAKLSPRKIFYFERDQDPLNVDMKRHQLNKFSTLAAQIPLLQIQ